MLYTELSLSSGPEIRIKNQKGSRLSGTGKTTIKKIHLVLDK